jgi:hypothetical protein
MTIGTNDLNPVVIQANNITRMTFPTGGTMSGAVYIGNASGLAGKIYLSRGNAESSSITQNGASLEVTTPAGGIINLQKRTQVVAGDLAIGFSVLNGSSVAVLTVDTLNGRVLQGVNQVCDASNNCGYATAASIASGYIQNQTASPQTAGFNISGNATISGVLSSPGGGTNSQKLGSGAVASGSGDLAIGTSASASGSGSVAIGTSASASTRGVAIGQGSLCGDDSVAVGAQSSCGAGNSSVVIVGKDAKSTASSAVVIGRGASTAYSQTIVLSTGTLSTAHSPTASGQLVIADVNQGYFGNGVTSASPNNFTLNATGGSGSNVQGGNLTIASGKGTGSATGGNVLFQTSAAGAAGSTLNGLTTRMQIQGGTGNVSIGTTSDVGQLGIVNTNAAQVGLVVQAASSQSANLQEWRNASGSSYLKVTSNQDIRINGGGDARGIILEGQSTGYISGVLQRSSDGAFLGLATDGYGETFGVNRSYTNIVQVASSAGTQTSRVNMVLKAGSAQTTDLLQAQNSSGIALAKIDASGNLTVKNATVEGAYISFSNNIRGYNVAVASSVASQTVTFGTAHSDANYAVFCTPNWNTTCFVTNKTTTGFTLNYGSAAPAGQLVDWFVAR